MISRPRQTANQQRSVLLSTSTFSSSSFPADEASLSLLNSLTRVIVTLPFVIVSSWILYKRLILGEEQRTMPRPGQPGADQHVLGTSLSEEARRRRDGQPDGRIQGMPDDLAQRISEAERQARP